MAPSKEEKNAATEKGNDEKDVEGELNQWKFKAPYKIHDDFNALYEASQVSIESSEATRCEILPLHNMPEAPW
jgi:hypothetical protein